MAERALQLAIHETQSMFRGRGVWVALVSVGLILGIAGPFGTEEIMRLFPRLTYWVVISFLTFVSGRLISIWFENAMRHRLHKWVWLGLTGCAIGAVVTAEVLGLNWAVFGLPPIRPGYTLPLAINAVAVSIIVAVALDMLGAQSQDNSPDLQRLLYRLPIEKCGRLVALSVSDHYVEVMTRKRTELVLMRLSDAIAETKPEPGLQILRSHWIASNAVTSVKRDGARAIVTLNNGTEVPVSRTFLPAVKEAGLLPG